MADLLCAQPLFSRTRIEGVDLVVAEQHDMPISCVDDNKAGY
jgi:hypothetical protein